MSTTSQRRDEVTGVLVAWSRGEGAAADHLLPMVYDELRRLAARALRRESPDHTLEATALVHEAYLKLVDQSRVDWQNRGHFFAVAAQAMRRILIDHARRHHAKKRGGDVRLVPLDEVAVLLAGSEDAAVAASDLVALDRALDRLAAVDQQQARLVELRFFAGLTLEETATALGVSVSTVKLDWRLARAWLRRELAREGVGAAAGKSVRPVPPSGSP